MQAVVVPRHGGPEVLQLQQHPIPVPADAEVLIEQHCAGVNYIDTCDAMTRRASCHRSPALADCQHGQAADAFAPRR